MWKGNACSYTALATGKCSRSIYMPPLVVYKTQYSTTKSQPLFFDGHGSHLTYGTVKRVTEKEIIIIIIFFHHALNVCMTRFGSGT